MKEERRERVDMGARVFDVSLRTRGVPGEGREIFRAKSVKADKAYEVGCYRCYRLSLSLDTRPTSTTKS
jgi:hypothetical protein